jgi:hypothetical protein
MTSTAVRPALGAPVLALVCLAASAAAEAKPADAANPFDRKYPHLRAQLRCGCA